MEELAERSDEQASGGQAGCLLEELAGAGKRAMGPLEQPQREQDARSGFGTRVGVEDLGRQSSSAVGVTCEVRVLRCRRQPLISEQGIGSEPGRAFHGPRGGGVPTAGAVHIGDRRQLAGQQCVLAGRGFGAVPRTSGPVRHDRGK